MHHWRMLCYVMQHHWCGRHYNDVIMGAIASQITSLTIVYSTFYSDADQRKHQSSASLAFVPGIHWGLVNSLREWPVTRKMFRFDDVIMDAIDIIIMKHNWSCISIIHHHSFQNIDKGLLMAHLWCVICGTFWENHVKNFHWKKKYKLKAKGMNWLDPMKYLLLNPHEWIIRI